MVDFCLFSEGLIQQQILRFQVLRAKEEEKGQRAEKGREREKEGLEEGRLRENEEGRIWRNRGKRRKRIDFFSSEDFSKEIRFQTTEMPWPKL